MPRMETNKDWRLDLLRIRCRIKKKWQALRKAEQTTYVWDRIPLYREIWGQAASELSAQFTELAEGIWEVARGGRRTRICNHMVQLDDPVIYHLAGNKTFCYALLGAQKIPAARHAAFRLHEFHKAEQFMERNEGFVVVKPANGTSAGMGVTTHIASIRECREAAALASLYSDELIIEQFIPGESYRVLVLDNEVIHASRRSGLRVRGDGKSTLWQLAMREDSLRRGRNGDGPGRLREDDRDFAATLKAQGLTPESIPTTGRCLLVKSVAGPLQRTDEVRTVYTENVMGLIGPDIRRRAVQAAGSLHSRFAGVDIITLDPAVPLEKSGGVVVEINTTPGLHHHYHLDHDNGISPAIRVLEHILNRASPGVNRKPRRDAKKCSGAL